MSKAGGDISKACEQRARDDEGEEPVSSSTGGGYNDLRTQLENEMAALAPEWERTAAWPSGPASLRGSESGSELWWWYHERWGVGERIILVIGQTLTITTCSSWDWM